MVVEEIIKELFLPEWNTTAIITNKGVRVRLFDGKYYTEIECINYIHLNMEGLIQSAKAYRKAQIDGTETGAIDRLKPYEDLYKELKNYKI